MLQFLRPFSSKRFSIERMIISFVWQRYGKRHQKSLGNARKVAAEGESLKVVSEFYGSLGSGTFAPPDHFTAGKFVDIVLPRLLGLIIL